MIVQSLPSTRGWCATEETNVELSARWQDRKDARKRSWSTASLEGDHQTAETHAGGSCTEVLRRFR